MSGVIPSPMSESRLRTYQKRAAKQQPISDARDQAENVASMSRPHSVHARKAKATDARFDEDGDEIEIDGLWTWCDAYLKTPMGSASALQALKSWKRSWGR